MEAIKAPVKFVEFNAEIDTTPIGDLVAELNDLELSLVGGGSGDVQI